MSLLVHSPITLETSEEVKFSFIQWWPMLIGPAAMASVYLASMLNTPAWYAKSTHETLALIILPIPLLAFLIAAIRIRAMFFWIMTAVCIAFFCREWHFSGTSKGIYIGLAVIALWAWFSRTAILKTLQDHHLKIWCIATFCTYALSQIIARRLFKHLHFPNEHQLHVPFEEVAETAAHLTMLTTALIALWRSKRFLEK